MKKYTYNIFTHTRNECLRCKIKHKSKTYHDLCSWTKPKDLVRVFAFHEAALLSLDIYDIIEEWNFKLWHTHTPGGYDVTEEYDDMNGLAYLSPTEIAEAFKDWKFVRDNQIRYRKDLTHYKWTDFWKRKLLEHYDTKEELL